MATHIGPLTRRKSSSIADGASEATAPGASSGSSGVAMGPQAPNATLVKPVVMHNLQILTEDRGWINDLYKMCMSLMNNGDMQVPHVFKLRLESVS